VRGRGRAAWILASRRVKLGDLRIAESYALRSYACIEGLNCRYDRQHCPGGIRQCAKHAMRLPAWLSCRRVLVGRRIISGAVADDEYVTRCIGVRRREMADYKRTQDHMSRERTTCGGGNPSPQRSSIWARLHHEHTSTAFLALRKTELKTAPRRC
jgi:hypothetical protein